MSLDADSDDDDEETEGLFGGIKFLMVGFEESEMSQEARRSKKKGKDVRALVPVVAWREVKHGAGFLILARGSPTQDFYGDFYGLPKAKYCVAGGMVRGETRYSDFSKKATQDS